MAYIGSPAAPTVATVSDGTVTSAKLADDAVTSAKIVNDAVTSAKITDGAVTPSDLSTGHPNWDSSGNVGIGTASPSYDLEINDASDPTIRLYDTRGGTQPDVRIISHGTTGVGRIGTYSAKDFALMTNSTERMRITNAGFVNFNPAGSQNYFPYSETVKIDFNNTQSIHSNEVSNSTSVNHIYFTRGAANVANTFVGGIYWNGSTLAYQSASDYRLKSNVQTIVNGIDKVKQLNPVNFTWKHNDKKSNGFIAHELQVHCPDAVSLYKDAMKTEGYIVTPAVLDDDGNVVTEAVMGTREVPDYQGVDESKLVPLLTAALQEAITKIESLEARVATLESA